MIRRSKLHTAGFGLALSLLATEVRGQDSTPDFAKEILPVLQRSCFECHRAPETTADGRTKKPKGGLRLDGKGWILKGGENGNVLVANDPARSELLARVQLDADDPDVMPPKGEHLSAAEVAKLRAWIASGASFGSWEGEPGGLAIRTVPADGPAARPARLVQLERLAEGLDPLPPAAFERPRAVGARVEAALPGGALLRVSFPGHRDELGDAQLRALAPLGEHLAVLDLARTKVGARSMEWIAGLPRLTSLNLADTTVGSRELAGLAQLRELRSLNLNGTAVDDELLEVLANAPHLEEVYLWRSQVSAAGAKKLAAARPGLHVRHTLQLPPPAPEEPDTRNQRRR